MVLQRLMTALRFIIPLLYKKIHACTAFFEANVMTDINIYVS